MKPESPRVVLDTNVFVRGVVNFRSTSGRILIACENRKLLVLTSRPILREYRATLTHPALLARYPHLDTRRINVLLERVSYVGEVAQAVRTCFAFPRDERDAKFLELSIALDATYLISVDGDILDLREGRDDAGKRFRRRAPSVEILTPDEFVSGYM